MSAKPVHDGATVKGRATAVDGDTIDVGKVRIRLHGVDAPEAKQSCERNGREYNCGSTATLKLAELIATATVTCNALSRDRWNRTVARCFAEGQDLGQRMVQEGMAIAYRKYSTDYVADETLAQSLKLGIWSGTFTNPETWRSATVEKKNVRQ
ncbi:MAG: hypothetical protein JWN71_4186 [Xanthobacteraceae bacterium]|nr:hypothetical protein [Xanthobacteraceae bacterium]